MGMMCLSSLTANLYEPSCETAAYYCILHYCKFDWKPIDVMKYFKEEFQTMNLFFFLHKGYPVKNNLAPA